LYLLPNASQGFLGLSLLAVSALSAILNILGGMALGMAWVGLFVYIITGEHCRIWWLSSSAAVARMMPMPALRNSSCDLSVLSCCQTVSADMQHLR
jgi:hypothetical protein